MAKKRTNRNQRQLYSTPLPLPGLTQDVATLQSPSPAAATAATVTVAPCKRWSPVEALVEIFRGMVNQVTRCASSSPAFSSLFKTKRAQRFSNLIRAEFHPQGESVWITNPECMQRLFRQGFFGKGTLSRSEPSWKLRQQEKLQGPASPNLSLEDITRKRRIERAAVKKEKSLRNNVKSLEVSGQSSVSPMESPSSTAESSTHCSVSASPLLPQSPIPIDLPALDALDDMEHLQLFLEEAFFLVFAIEVIAIYDSSSVVPLENNNHNTQKPMTIRECWHRFAKASMLVTTSVSLKKQSLSLDWENPFIVRYVAYHHFRSHGWVVKDGLKYGVDFLLYRKGVVFGHSAYAVKVISGAPQSPEMNDEPQVTASGDFPILTPRPFLGKVDPWHHPLFSWPWLLNLNRVVNQVQKTLLLCHVIPPHNASSLPEHTILDPHLALLQYNVVEITSRRWIPERNRA